MIISLAQRKTVNQKLHQIGFTIYQATGNDLYDLNFFKNNKAIATSGSYINYREVFGRFTLTKGSFIVIPATFLPETECEFLLRIFSQEKITLQKIQ